LPSSSLPWHILHLKHHHTNMEEMSATRARVKGKVTAAGTGLSSHNNMHLLTLQNLLAFVGVFFPCSVQATPFHRKHVSSHELNYIRRTVSGIGSSFGGDPFSPNESELQRKDLTKRQGGGPWGSWRPAGYQGARPAIDSNDSTVPFGEVLE
jgi:hypothetical protein